MPHSLKSKIKSLCYKGEITEKERDKIIHALEKQPKMQDCEHCIHTYGTLGCCDMVNNEWIYDCEFGKEQYKKEHEQQPCEKDVLKFYYVESLDDYWIGERLDTMYYAEWDFELQGFVWTHSKYLPWGEHVVAPNTLWKEHTYPSEPKEIPVEKWIKGFLKKHGRDQQPCEDCISREAVIRLVEQYPNIIGNRCSGLIADIKHLPSVTPQQRWIPVSEKLPEENIHVLCQFYMGGMAECYHAHDYWHIVGGFRIKIDFILAWMPLPQPYTESEESE